MTRMRLLLIVCIALIASLSYADDVMDYGRFGKLTVYRTSEEPGQVVLFVSGDGGWNEGVIDMARSLAALDALVVGIDITHYLHELAKTKDTCLYPAADFENLSKFVQRKLGVRHYRPPILVGYSSGATLVYAILAQAPPDTFRGAISMGFCPDLPLNKAFCGGHGLRSRPSSGAKGFDVLPSGTLANPWVAFQGTIDQVCDSAGVETFAAQVNRSELVILPKVGHGFSVQKNWLPQFRQAFTKLSGHEPGGTRPSSAAIEISDLPLVDLPPSGPGKNLQAVIVSGDGGWASLDRELGSLLARQGIGVIGLNTLQYFWTPKNPEKIGQDLTRILNHALTGKPDDKVLLIGYSFGADVLPFMTSRLPETLLSRVAGVVLLSPATEANFEFHLSDWLDGGSAGTPVAPELAKLQGLDVLCLYGRDEKGGLCQSLPTPPPRVKALPLAGGHHFGGDIESLAQLILEELRITNPPGSSAGG